MMDLFGSFHLLRPAWLLAALPPLVFAALSVHRTRTGEQWRGSIAPHLLAHLVTRSTASPWRSPAVVMAPLAVVLAIAMAGPTYRLADTPEGPDETTLIVIVDLSRSMAGQDIGPSRAGRLRLKLRDLLELRRGAQIGIVAVAGTAHVVMPPTDDADALVPYVDVLAPDLMPDDGERFEDAAVLAATLASAEEGPAVVLVAADAIPPAGADALAALVGNETSVIGWAIGTDAGRPSEGLDGLDRTGFDRLERGGARVVDLSLGNGDLRQIDALLDRARTAAADADDASLWEDAGYALVPLFALGVLYWFRRGWVIGRATPALLVLALLGISSGCGGQGAADAGDGSWWLDLWLTPDQQGRRLFEAGEYEAAAERFEDPMWKGIAYYTAHDWDGAKTQFARVDTVAGLYNLGNAYAQAREIASAIAAYDRILTRQPTHRAARQNRELLQDILDGLVRSSDRETLARPPDQPADQTAAMLRPDQLEGPEDPSQALPGDSPAATLERTLDQAQSAQWMERVTTSPAEFLRTKFAIQAARGGAR